MRRSSRKTQRVSEPVESLETRVSLIAAMAVNALRIQWREVFWR